MNMIKEFNPEDANLNLNSLYKEINYSLDTESNIISNNEIDIKDEDKSVKEDHVEAHSSLNENDNNNIMSISDHNDEIDISKNNYNLLSEYEGLANNFDNLSIVPEKNDTLVKKAKTRRKSYDSDEEEINIEKKKKKDDNFKVKKCYPKK